MIGAVNGMGAGMCYAWNVRRNAQAAQTVEKPISQQETGMQLRLSGEGTMPVQPVQRVRALGAPATQGSLDVAQKMEQGQYMDPAELAVRMRMQTGDAENTANTTNTANAAGGTDVQTAEVQSAQEVMEEGECQTCAERKYQDGSDDMGVSFQTPAHIAPENAAATVRGHEMEHVSRNRAKAEREGKEIVSQSVTLHSEICPECGKIYIAGGTTRTTTRDIAEEDNHQQLDDVQSGAHFSAVA